VSIVMLGGGLSFAGALTVIVGPIFVGAPPARTHRRFKVDEGAGQHRDQHLHA
jgi:hypothetical protein